MFITAPPVSPSLEESFLLVGFNKPLRSIDTVTLSAEHIVVRSHETLPSPILCRDVPAEGISGGGIDTGTIVSTWKPVHCHTGMCFYVLPDKTWNKTYGVVIKTYISYVCVTGAFVCPNIVNFHNY